MAGRAVPVVPIVSAQLPVRLGAAVLGEAVGGSLRVVGVIRRLAASAVTIRTTCTIPLGAPDPMTPTTCKRPRAFIIDPMDKWDRVGWDGGNGKWEVVGYMKSLGCTGV